MKTLRELVTKKTGYITDALFHVALAEAKKDIERNREISKDTWKFDTWSKAEKLQYIADAMAVYVIMERRVSK